MENISPIQLDILLRSMGYRPVEPTLWAKPIGYGLATFQTDTRELTSYQKKPDNQKEIWFQTTLSSTWTKEQVLEGIRQFEAYQAQIPQPSTDDHRGFAFLTEEDNTAHLKRTFDI